MDLTKKIDAHQTLGTAEKIAEIVGRKAKLSAELSAGRRFFSPKCILFITYCDRML